MDLFTGMTQIVVKFGEVDANSGGSSKWVKKLSKSRKILNTVQKASKIWKTCKGH